MVTGLKLEYTYIMAIGVLASLVRVFVTPFWGRLANKKSWFFSQKCLLVYYRWFTFYGFCCSYYCPISNSVLQVVSGMAWAGIGISLFNIQFLFAKREGRTMYLGLNAAIGGIAGFLRALDWI